MVFHQHQLPFPSHSPYFSFTASRDYQRTSSSRYAQVAESVAQRLLNQSREPVAAENFAVIGDRIAKYSRIAEALVKDDSIDEVL